MYFIESWRVWENSVIKVNQSNEKKPVISMVERGKGFLRSWNHNPLVDAEMSNIYFEINNGYMDIDLTKSWQLIIDGK